MLDTRDDRSARTAATIDLFTLTQQSLVQLNSKRLNAD